MKIANHSVRTSSPYIYKHVNGVLYQFCAATYVPKAKAYYLAKKAVEGKIDLNPEKRGMEVQENGTVRYYEI